MRTRTARSLDRSAAGTELGLEALEPRLLLAGDVTAAMVGGNLLIRGDTAANSIVVAPAGGAGAVEVSGTDGTTINGDAGSVLFDGFTGRLKAELGPGDDALALVGLPVPGRASVRTGSGDDVITFSGGSIGGRLLVDTATGQDEVAFNGAVIAGKTHIRSAPGGAPEVGDGNLHAAAGSPDIGAAGVVAPNPQVHIEVRFIALDTDFEKDLGVRFGAGNDSILMQHSFVGGDARFKTKAGEDHFQALDTRFFRALAVNTGGDTDSTLLAGGRADTATFDLGRGDDLLTMSGTRVIGGLNVRGLFGPNTVVLDGVNIGGNAVLDLGRGANTLGIGGQSVFIGDLKVDTNCGVDTVNIGGHTRFYGGIQVNPGPGCDLITIIPQVVHSKVVVNAAAGNDTVTIGGLWRDKLAVRGGQGDDTIDITPMLADVPVLGHLFSGGQGADTLRGNLLLLVQPRIISFENYE